MKRLLYLLSIILFIAGCASRLPIRVSEKMTTENPVKNIAIIGEGRIEWPRMTPFKKLKEPVLGLAETKKALGDIMAATSKAFSEKGYKVVFSKPVGIGYYNPFYKENWVMETATVTEDSDKNEKGIWQVEGRKPVYLYLDSPETQEFNKVIKHVFEQWNIDIFYNTFITLRSQSPNQVPTYHFVPSIYDLKRIQEFTGGDTICFNRVFGVKYTTARKVGITIVALLTPMSLRDIPTDLIGSYVSCVNAATGEILWQNSIYFEGDPTDFDSSQVMSAILKHFPNANETLEPACCLPTIQGINLLIDEAKQMKKKGDSAWEDKIDEVLNYLEKAIKQDKFAPSIWIAYAKAYYVMNRPDVAEKYLLKNLKLNPQHVGLLMAQGDLYVGNYISGYGGRVGRSGRDYHKDYAKEAILAYKKAAEYASIDDEYSESLAFYKIGNVYDLLDDPEEAKKYWLKAVSTSPDSEGALLAKKKLQQKEVENVIGKDKP